MSVGLVPHLIIGLGGQGLIILNKIKKLAIENYVNPKEHGGVHFPLVEYLGIDSTLHDLQHNETSIVLDSKYEITTVNIEPAKEIFERPGLYEDNIQKLINDPEIIEIAKEKFKEITEGCGGYPLICRIAGLLDVVKIENIIRQKLLNLTAVDRINDLLQRGGYLDKYHLASEENKSLNIYIINSLSGGTGRGLYELVSFLAKKVATEFVKNEENVKVMLFSLMPSVFSYGGKDLSYAQVNAYAGVKEIDSFLEGNYKPESYIKSKISRSLNIKLPIDFFIPVGGVYSTVGGVSAGPAFLSVEDARHSIAKFIADSIFTGTSSWILARISNLSNILDKPVIESESGRKRNRRYFRVMYSSLTLPVDDMFEYSSLMLKHTLLLDLLGGTLEPPEDVKNSVLNKTGYVERLLDYVKSNTATPNIRKTKIESSFYYANVDAISNSFKNFVDSLNTIIDSQKNNIPINAKDFVSSLRNEEFINIVKVHGLEGLSSILEDLIKSLKIEVAGRLGKTSLVLDFSSEVLSIKQEIDNNIREIEELAEKKKQLLESIFNKYEGLIGVFRKLLRGGRLSSEDANIVKSEIDNFNGSITSYIDKIERGLQDYFLIHIIQALEEYKGVIDSEIKQVKEIYGKVESLMCDIEKKAYGKGVTKLILKNRKEGKIVFNAILDYINNQDKINYLKKYDKEFMEEELYTHYIASYDKPHNLDYKGELEKILNRLSRSFYAKLDEKLEKSLRAFYVIYNYLSKKTSDTEMQIKRILEEPLKKLYFWGAIESMEEKSAGYPFKRSDTVVVKVLFPERFTKDENYTKIEEEIRNVMGQYFSPDFGVLDRHFPETQILVIGHHMGLSAFTFTDIQESRQKYMKEPLEQRKLRHIKPEFVYLAEPVGISTDIDDFYYLLNVAYQIKAIKGNILNVKDEEKVAQIQGRSIRYEPLKVKTIRGEEISIRYIKTDQANDDSILFPDLVDKISKAIVDKFFYLLIKLSVKSKEFKRLKDFICPETPFRNQKEKVIPFTPELVIMISSNIDEYSIPDDKRAILDSWLSCYDYSHSETVKRDKTFRFCENIYITTQKQKKVGLFVFPYE